MMALFALIPPLRVLAPINEVKEVRPNSYKTPRLYSQC